LLASDLAVPSFFSSFLEAMLLAIANVLSEFCQHVMYQSNENQRHDIKGRQYAGTVALPVVCLISRRL
jgi:hypothetical protein